MFRANTVIAGRLRLLKLDLRRAAAQLTAQLQNADDPKACPSCLHVFSRAIWDGSCEAVTLDLMSTSHDFWSSCARAASAPGADGDLGPLRRKLDANKLACRTKRNHVHALSAPGDSVACFFDALCSCLYATLKLGPHKKQKNVFLAMGGLWPARLDQIMPATLAPYARWACIVPTHYPLALLSRLTVVARRRVMDDIVTTPARERVAASCVRALTLGETQDAEFPAASHALIARDPLMGTPDRPESLRMLGQALGLLVVFQAGPDRRLNDFADFAVGFEGLLHDAIVDIASDPAFGTQYDRDILIGAASALAARGALPVHPAVAEYRQKPHIQRYLTEGLTVGDIIYLYLRQRLDSRGCSGPDCANCGRAAEDGMKQLLVCGQCRIMRYCGPECQRLDWRFGCHGVPHKGICSAIRKFRDAGILEAGKTMNDFSHAYFDPGFLTVDEFVLLAKLALTDDLIPRDVQLGALSRFESSDLAASGPTAEEGSDETAVGDGGPADEISD